MKSSNSVSSPDSPSMLSPDLSDKAGVSKGRKFGAAGGGRAWSEEEEVYLLQTRLKKMPYKQIAAHLRKTELACRLHYHQVCHSSNRNKTKSISSASSPETPMFSEQYHNGARDSPITSPEPATPYSAMRSPHPSTRQYALAKHMANGTRDGKHLHLDLHSRSTVDMEKLNSIYEHYKGAFWKLVAAEYGDGIDPAALERSFRRGYPLGNNSPHMTPIDSALMPTTASSMPDSVMQNAQDRRSSHNLMPPPFTGVPKLEQSGPIFTPPARPASQQREMLTLPPLNGSATPVADAGQPGSRAGSQDADARRSLSPSSSSGHGSLPRIKEVLMS